MSDPPKPKTAAPDPADPQEAIASPADQSKTPRCLRAAPIVSLPAGARVFQPGDAANQFVFLLSGSIRVDLVAASGKAITLYRFGPQETCVLTTSCLLSGEQYCAEARAEAPVVACVVPKAEFETMIDASSEFRRLVFSSFSARLAAMMGKIEEIACMPIDARLAGRVLELGDGNAIVSATHERLAMDLGTAREVVSRKLARWEREGVIARGRRRFEIIDANALKAIAGSGRADD